ncbi:MAG: hypothetical protein K2X74_09360 [Acetobacteraceae bacterium]|nr:hypothetical protein [Acetobacteraceae bacterium]
MAGVLAVSGTVLIGMVALAAEAGVWHLQLRQTRTAADLGALAGAAAIERAADPVAVARDAVARNGFVSEGEGGRTSVFVARPPTSGAHVGRADAVEVVVSQTQTLGMARLVLRAPPVVTSRAVAASAVDMRVCALALGGGLTLGSSATQQGAPCALAANGPGGIDVAGGARVRVQAFMTNGGCTGCTSGDVWADGGQTQRPVVLAGRPNPVADPYRGLQQWRPAPPACRATPVAFAASGGRAATIDPADGAICDSLTVGANDTLTIRPGLYHVARGASLDIRGTVTGSGVTIVLTDDNPGTIGTVAIHPGANVDLAAPVDSLVPGHPEGRGVLIYRDARATSTGAGDTVRLNGGPGMRLTGAIYTPTTDVMVNGGGTTASAGGCMPVVGRSVSLARDADTRIDVAGCADMPVARVARLVE